jgi:hypothetical protein
MPKKPKPSAADQFSDEDMHQIKHYGQMLGGGVTPFDEAVEEALNKREANEEASAKKMHAAQTGAPEAAAQSLAPSQMDQAAIKQRSALQQQAATEGAQAAAQAQGAQTPVNAPPAPVGPQGATIPFSTQKGAVGGPGNVQQPSQAPPPPAPGPGGPQGEPEEEEPNAQ